jgi:hypothetical protein
VADTAHDLERLLLLNDDELLDELGDQLASIGFGPGDDEGNRESAQRWLGRNMASLQRVICGNPAVQTLTAQDNDALAEVGAVADLLADLLGRPIGATVAAILVKQGLRRLCADTAR